MEVSFIWLDGPDKGRVHRFPGNGDFFIGREGDCALALANDPLISGRHLILKIGDFEVEALDNDSKNGVYINNLRHGGRKPPLPGVQQAPASERGKKLSPGDEIRVGTTRFKVEFTPPPRPAPGVAEGGTVVQGGANPAGDSLLDELLGAANQKPAGPPAPQFPGYRIEGELGRGGMGVVYRAVREATGERVALKTILPQASASPRARKTFIREVDLTRQLNHPNIVQLIESGEAEGSVFFALEFVEGKDLAGYLKDFPGGKLPLAQAIPIILGILEGLAFAHTATLTVDLGPLKRESFRGLVHRDLKPQNVLLRLEEGRDPIAKIADFGLAKSFEAAGLTDFTCAGQVGGTPVYWPKEQLIHYRYLTPATDVYSIAAVIFEMLTGLPPRPGFAETFSLCKSQGRNPDIHDYMRVINANLPHPIRELEPTIPEAVAKVIDRALFDAGEVPADEREMQKRLAECRYPDAGAFKQALEAAFRQSHPTR